MNRRGLVAAVAARLGDERAADAVLAALCEVIADAVARGEPVAIDGFGRFSRVQRPARGVVPATYVPRFDPAREPWE